MQLIKETKTYRCDSEDQAAKLVDKFKTEAIEKGYEVKKTVTTQKLKKQKGEVVDMFYLVDVTVSYEVE